MNRSNKWGRINDRHAINHGEPSQTDGDDVRLRQELYRRIKMSDEFFFMHNFSFEIKKIHNLKII